MTRAEFQENLLVALDTLRAHKVRSALTLLGIVIGVTSVISVAAIINGLNRFISDRIEQLGSRSYFVGRMGFGSSEVAVETRRRIPAPMRGGVRQFTPPFWACRWGDAMFIEGR